MSQVEFVEFVFPNVPTLNLRNRAPYLWICMATGFWKIISNFQQDHKLSVYWFINN